MKQKENALPDDTRQTLRHNPGRLWFLIGMLTTASCAAFCYQRDPCHRPRPGFVSVVERGLPAGDEECYSKTIDLSGMRTFSFLVLNDGTNPVVVQPELSPDGVTWDPFGELPYVIEAGRNRLLVLQFFLRYARIKFRNKNRGRDTVITVWFQGQS